MGCPVCNCIFCASSADACCQQAIGISLCGLEPNCLVIVQSVIFLFFFLFWQMGFSFFLFFHLKEIPCTCQMYCMKVITEPWRKYLNDALVMCCSDNFSFQSTTTTTKKKDNKLLFYYENVFMCLYSSFTYPRVLRKCHPSSITKIFFSCKQQNYKIKLVTSCDFTLNHILTVVFFRLNLPFCLPECQTGK